MRLRLKSVFVVRDAALTAAGPYRNRGVRSKDEVVDFELSRSYLRRRQVRARRHAERRRRPFAAAPAVAAISKVFVALERRRQLVAQDHLAAERVAEVEEAEPGAAVLQEHAFVLRERKLGKRVVRRDIRRR